MDNVSKTKKTLSVASTFVAISGILHIISAIKIMNWGLELDIEVLPTDPDYYFNNRLPVVIYLFVIAGLVLFHSFISFYTHVQNGEKTYTLILSCWLSTILSMIFNFATGVFLLIWMAFNFNFLINSSVYFYEMPTEYQTMTYILCIDAVYTLVAGVGNSLLLFYHDSLLLSLTRINSHALVEPTRRTSELPKLFV